MKKMTFWDWCLVVAVLAVLAAIFVALMYVLGTGGLP